MRSLFLANCDNFKHSHKTRTNLSDVTFTEILLRGRVFKTSRNTLTVTVPESPTERCGNAMPQEIPSITFSPTTGGPR